METPSRRRRAAAMLALVASLAIAAAPIAEARPGGGFGGFGSRGSRTYSPPSGTATSPGASSPIQRSQTQPSPGYGSPGYAGQPRGRFGGGFMGGLLGAGLIGALLGSGFFGGFAGFGSFLGFLLQLALIAGLVMLAVRFFRSRNAPAFADGGAYGRSSLSGNAAPPPPGGGFGGFGNAVRRDRPVAISPGDFDAFERTLTEIQTAYGREDVGALRRIATPEMVGYFEEELRANAARGVVNRISDVKLLQGDLSESWGEGRVDYATVAMRFALKDETIERASGRVVENGPSEAKEFWTFLREPGGAWKLSAIQQAR